MILIIQIELKNLYNKIKRNINNSQKELPKREFLVSYNNYLVPVSSSSNNYWIVYSKLQLIFKKPSVDLWTPNNYLIIQLLAIICLFPLSTFKFQQTFFFLIFFQDLNDDVINEQNLREIKRFLLKD